MNLFTTSPGMGNPLVRRLQRHAQMTTLFHMPPNQVPHNGNHTIMRSVFLPPDTSEGVHLVSEPNLQPVSSLENADGSGQPFLAESKADFPTARPVSTTPASQPAQSHPQGQTAPFPAASPTSSVQAKPESEDGSWRRLQTIFNRHMANSPTEELTADIEPISPAQPDSKPPASAQPPGDTPIQNASWLENLEAPTDTRKAFKPVSSPADKPVTPDSQDSAGRSGAKIQRIPEPIGAEKDADSAVSSVEWPETQTAVTQQPASSTEQPLQRTTTPLAKATLSQSGQKPNHPIAEAANIPSTDVASSRSFENMEADRSIPSVLPLEDVWPVSINQPIARKAASQPLISPSSPVSPEETAALSQNRAQMQQLLSSVPSGQPSESNIELVAPRRPRPAISSKPIQAKSEPAQMPKQHPADNQTAEQPLQPAFVPTEIGPLPADLWEIMEQPAPVNAGPMNKETAPTIADHQEIKPPDSPDFLPPSSTLLSQRDHIALKEETITPGQRHAVINANSANELGTSPLPSSASKNRPAQQVPTVLQQATPDHAGLSKDASEPSHDIGPDAKMGLTQSVQQPAQPILQRTQVDSKAMSNLGMHSRQPMPPAKPSMAPSSADRIQNHAAPPVTPSTLPDVSHEPADVPSSLGKSMKVDAGNTAVLQRSPAPTALNTAEEIETSRPTKLTDAETKPETEPAEPEMELDIEGLARQVYSQIKRRLNIDWERLRHS